MDDRVLDTLREAQRVGMIGDRPVAEAAEHARAFVAALGDLPAGTRLIDLGSGGGLPGLVLAGELPHVSILLVDRRQKRTDFLERAVRRHRWSHVTVRHADVEEVAEEVTAGMLARFDVVTARGFGPPATTLRLARAVVAVGGQVVISEPPSGDRWPHELLDSLGLSRTHHGAVSTFVRYR